MPTKSRKPETQNLGFALIDTHAHLDRFEPLEPVIQRAREAGVTAVVGVGMDLDSNRKILTFARRYPDVVLPAIGYHPWRIEAHGVQDTVDFIAENLDACVALGEIGLDYKVKVKKRLQWDLFARLLDLAKTHGKPVIVHCRYSHQRAWQMVRDAGTERAVFHWYSGPMDTLEALLAAGHFISATPALSYSTHHRKAITAAPMDQILIETDCPVEFEGLRSEPAHVIETLRLVCEIKGLSLEEAGRITSRNAERFFGIRWKVESRR